MELKPAGEVVLSARSAWTDPALEGPVRAELDAIVVVLSANPASVDRTRSRGWREAAASPAGGAAFPPNVNAGSRIRPGVRHHREGTPTRSPVSGRLEHLAASDRERKRPAPRRGGRRRPRPRGPRAGGGRGRRRGRAAWPRRPGCTGGRRGARRASSRRPSRPVALATVSFYRRGRSGGGRTPASPDGRPTRPSSSSAAPSLGSLDRRPAHAGKVRSEVPDRSLPSGAAADRLGVATAFTLGDHLPRRRSADRTRRDPTDVDRRGLFFCVTRNLAGRRHPGRTGPAHLADRVCLRIFPGVLSGLEGTRPGTTPSTLTGRPGQPGQLRRLEGPAARIRRQEYELRRSRSGATLEQLPVGGPGRFALARGAGSSPGP